MRLEIDIAEHHYNNIMALDSVSLGRAPYKGIIMYSINAIKHGKVLDQESTTKNDSDVQKAIEIIKADSLAPYSVNEILSARDLAVEALKQMATTKNYLGVDCISREQALVAIRNLYPGMPRVDFNGSLRKWVDKYKPYIECDDAIKQLPSVTPQEPRWIPVSERLPEDSGEYLVSVTDKEDEGYKQVGVAWFAHPKDYDMKDGEWRELMIDEVVIAWMPLPQSYREVEE